MKKWDWLLAILFFLSFLFVYSGFYYPDPFFYTGGASSGLQKLLLVIRIVLPLLALAVFLMFWLWRRGTVLASNIFLLLSAIALATGSMYVLASHLYYTAAPATPLNQYHPYLQLTPGQQHSVSEMSDTSQPRIFFIGGSTTQWLNSQGQSWQELVESALNKQLNNQNVQCFNLGMEWYNSQHLLLNYAVNLRQYRPEFLVVMVGINDLLVNADFSWLSKGRFHQDYRHFLGPVTRLIKRQSFQAMLKEKLSAAWYHHPRTTREQFEFPGLVSFRNNMSSIIDLARKDGTQVILMTEPYLYKEQLTPDELDRLTMLNYQAVGPEYRWTAATMLRGMQSYNDTLRTLAQERQLTLIDLEQQVPKELKFIRDDVHYTDAAFPLIADVVSRELLPLLQSDPDLESALHATQAK